MLRIPVDQEQPTPRSRRAEIRSVIEREAQALALVAQRVADDWCDAIDCLAEATGNIIVTGMGKAGLIGQKVAATLASTGSPAHFLHPAEARHGDLGRVHPGDVVLAFSHSGETEEITQILPMFHDREAAIVAITNRPTSSLARMSDHVMAYGPVDEACPLGLAPSTSCVVMLAIGDAISFSLMRRRSFQAEDFARLHPAGSLGRQLQRVEQVMRTGQALRLASSASTVREVFKETSKPGRRTGAICLIDEAGNLDGLFTDSDLARLFERGQWEALDEPIANWMTRDPITVRSGWLVRDVVDFFKAHQVSEIPVMDEDNRPLGIVDITDLVDLLPEAA